MMEPILIILAKQCKYKRNERTVIYKYLFNYIYFNTNFNMKLLAHSQRITWSGTQMFLHIHKLTTNAATTNANWFKCQKLWTILSEVLNRVKYSLLSILQQWRSSYKTSVHIKTMQKKGRFTCRTLFTCKTIHICTFHFSVSGGCVEVTWNVGQFSRRTFGISDPLTSSSASHVLSTASFLPQCTKIFVNAPEWVLLYPLLYSSCLSLN